jgi:hypothetical protein
MLENRANYLEDKLDKKIKYNKALMKRVTDFMRKEQGEKEVKEEAFSRSKKGRPPRAW